ncbi:hypothetical protein SPFL3102_03046 [Sporomusaceae bacterium FL31]|nr:hypothetical protein SPFL3101_00998 [Sporomusaceae bacterium FL31]GCE35210.1 hypothetical protein SPFL3102_03046 [Sporomusaceae bacterium]
MAAKVVLFPQKNGYNVTEVEGLIRKWLAELSANEDLIETVTTRMVRFIDTYANSWFEPIFDLPVPTNFSQNEAEAILAAIEKGMDHTASQVQMMMNKIIVERFFLEIDLYENRNNSKKSFRPEFRQRRSD